MHYFTQEFRIDLPEISTDRTVNVLTLNDPARGIPFQIVVNRDLLLAGETLQDCFERQVGVMTRQTQAFKAFSKKAIEVGPAQIAAMEIESSFTQSSKTFHQLQAMFVTQAPRLLVLTLSSHVPIHDGHREMWSKALASLELRFPEAE